MNKRSLTEGVTALTGFGKKKKLTDSLLALPLDVVFPDEEQDRDAISDEDIQEFARTLKKEGQRRPIEVRPSTDGKYVIIAGERRWRALKLNNADTIMCIVRNKISDQQASLDQLTENVARENLNPLQLAKALKKRIDQYGYTQAELAEILGKKPSWVKQRVALLSMDEGVQELAGLGLVTGYNNLNKLNQLASKDPEQFLGVSEDIKHGNDVNLSALLSDAPSTGGKTPDSTPSPKSSAATDKTTARKKTISLTLPELAIILSRAMRKPSGFLDPEKEDFLAEARELIGKMTRKAKN